MGANQSTQSGAQGSSNLGQRVGQLASSANTGAQQFAAGLGAAAQRTAEVTQAAGQFAQAAGPALNSLKLAMASLQRQQGATYGGSRASGGFFGGDDGADPAKELREYESSLSAAAKENIIRGLARALTRVGIKVDPEGDPDVIVRMLVEQIPNPRRNNKTFPGDAQVHVKVCRMVADVLNAEFTPGETTPSHMFIDTTLGPVEVCRAVGEWVHSFAMGVNTEFLTVHTSARNALRSIEILEQIMAELHAKISQKVRASRDPQLEREVEPLDEIYARAQGERRRQEEVLKNILHVQLAPAAKELEMALREESEQNALIQKLGLTPGTSEFGDALAMAVSGLGTAAAVAQRVNKALKQVGATVRQYLDSPDFKAFSRALDERIESGQVNPEDLAKFLEAIETLRYGFSNRENPQFRETLEEIGKTGGRRGGADEEKSSIERRSERRETEKRVILRDFAARMARHYDELLASIKALAPDLGKKIPLTERTDALRDALTRLQGMHSERIELALVGLYMDAEARERKERFVNALRLVSQACSSVMELDMYRASSGAFARLRGAIDSLEKTIDTFADVIVKKFGGEATDAADIDSVYGGARGGDDALLPEIARSALSLNEAVRDFTYYYYVANVRANLDQTSAELEGYGQKYTELLGDAVAARLVTIGMERKALLEENPANAGRVTDANRGHLPAWLGAGNDPAFNAAKQWIADEYTVKERFYRVLQAVDLYMRAFTAGITKNPDATRDIKKMLDGTQVIARWFSAQTGEHLWHAFDRMGSTNFTGGPAPAAAGKIAVEDAVGVGGAAAAHPIDHYYERVGRAADDTFGIPEMGIHPDLASDPKKSVDEVFNYLQSLKNLVNAFIRIGEQFGGRELRAQSFMSPAQMYKTLIDYLKQSALSINVRAKPVAARGAMAGLPAVAAGADPRALRLEAIDDPSLNTIQAVNAAVGPYEVYFGAVGSGPTADLVGNFEVEDRYFVLIVKAMAAKILTTLGVYDMFERTTPLVNLTPIRMIIGGAPEADPEVLEGATELYFRLPRLAEFYREFLRWDGDNPNVAHHIAMLPELEGVFSGLIRLIFQKIASPQTGDYSETELRAVIREINTIYSHFLERSREAPVRAAISAFVLEVNRRYGVIKREDMKTYFNMLQVARTGKYDPINDTNYAILPGEDEVEIDRRAPSDRYVGPGAPTAVSLGALPSGRIPLDVDWDPAGTGGRKMLRDFRQRLDAELLKVDRSAYGNITYSLLIQQAAAEIRRAADKGAQLDVAIKLIQGASVVSTNSDKAFMFHETVVVGLNVLSAIQAFIARFEDTLNRMDPVRLENDIMNSLYLEYTAAPARAMPALTRAVISGLINAHAGRPANYYDRYIVNADSAGRVPPLSFNGRSGIPLNATPDALFDWMLREIGAVRPGGAAAPAQEFNALGASDRDPLRQNNPSGYLDATPAGMPVRNLRVLRALRLFARFATDYGLIMRDYVENIFDLTNSLQGLVECRFVQTSPPSLSLNFSKLRGLCEALLASVKTYFELFRPYLPKATVDRFEARTSPGSIFWLEENLVDRHLRGKSDSPDDQRRTLDGLSRHAANILHGLTRETFVQTTEITAANLVAPAAPAAAPGAAPAPPPAGALSAAIAAAAAAGGAWPALPAAGAPPALATETRFEWYGQEFSGLVFYNAVDFESGQTGITLNGGLAAEYALGGQILTARAAAPPPVPVSAGGGLLQRFRFYQTDQGFTRYRSLLFVFNQLVARYLNTLTDTAGGTRIYINLVNAFANGVMSRAVAAPAGNTYPDLAAAAEPFGLRGDPQPAAVLFQSLAWILQRFVKDMAPPNNTVPDHLVATLTDVPLYMKEAFRANLPSFIKFFDLLIKKCDFVKQFVQKTPVNLNRPSQQAIAAAAKTAALVGQKIVPAAGADRGDAANEYPPNALRALKPFDAGLTSALMKADIAALTDAISGGAYSLSNSSAEVLKELGDNPVFFQTNEGSIEMYKMRNGRLPLMPLSLAMWFLRDLESPLRGAAPAVDDTTLFPRHTLGEEAFKLMYGARQLLMRASPVGFEQVPSVKASLDAYNGVTAQRERIEEGAYLAFVRHTVTALRFFIEARNFKAMLSTSSRLFSTASLIGGGSGITPYAAPIGMNAATGSAVYALAPAVTEQTVLSVVESSNQDEEVGKMTERIGDVVAGAAGAGRDRERILNLVDMNIIPINVHALMRDIPLANLYNYEFTFEQMAASIFGEQSALYTADPSARGAISDVTTRKTRQMFLRLLTDPYMSVSEAMYGSEVKSLGSAGFVHRLFRGDNDLGMGRPKFLSDQLFNKALFGSIYQSRSDFDEGGPAVGIGAARGRQGVGRGPLAAALDSAWQAMQKMQAIEAGVTGATVLNVALAANAAAVRGQVAAARAAVDGFVFVLPGGQYEAILSIGQDLEAAYQALIGVATAAALRATMQPILNQFRVEVINKLAAVLAVSPDRTGAGAVAAAAARIAAAGGIFDNNMGDALWQFASARANSAANLLAAVLAARGANSFQNLAVSEANPPRAFGAPHQSQRTGQLTYPRTPDPAEGADEASSVVQVELPATVHRDRLEAIGKLRFDTRLVRDIFFIGNVVRLVRLKLNRDLTQSRSVLVASHLAVAPGVTEFGSDPYSPNENWGSTPQNGVPRFNDQDTY